MLGISLEITSRTDIFFRSWKTVWLHTSEVTQSFFTFHFLFQGSGDSYKPNFWRGTHVQCIYIYIERGSYYKAWMMIIPLTSNCKNLVFKAAS